MHAASIVHLLSHISPMNVLDREIFTYRVPASTSIEKARTSAELRSTLGLTLTSSPIKLESAERPRHGAARDCEEPRPIHPD